MTEIQAEWFGTGNELKIFSDKPPVPPGELRAMLLFFDKIDVPSNNLVGTGIGEFENLLQLGVAHRSRVIASGAAAAGLSVVPFQAFLENERREPGRWALGQSSQSIGFPDDALTPGQGFAMKLQNALPVFDRSVVLEDVLEFRLQRRAELLALREYMDDFIREAAASGFEASVATAAFDRFDSAIADHIKTMRESNLSKVLTDLRVDWDQIVQGAVGVGASMVFGMPLSAAAWTFGSGAVASVALSTAKTIRVKRMTQPFRYLTSAEKNLF